MGIGTKFVIFIQIDRMKPFLFVIILFFSFFSSIAQEKEPFKVAVFAPLYIDSAFNGSDYKIKSVLLPRYMLAGLDFYQGVTLAADSLRAENKKLEIKIYDTKSTQLTVQKLLQSDDLKSVSLIIASITNTQEQKLFSTFSETNKIPIISSTYPNAQNVQNNPYFIIVNSTLETHVEGLYHFIQKNYPTRNIVCFRKNGFLENRIQETFTSIQKNGKGVKLNIKFVNLPETFNEQQVLKALDSNKNNLVICGSLSENFGYQVSRIVSTYAANYANTIIGMPTWDLLKELNQPECSNVDIVYSTPYEFTRDSLLYQRFANLYREKLQSNPGDMAYKGFETTFRFIQLLLDHNGDYLNHLSDTTYRLFNEYQLAPVVDGNSIQYIENKKLYFVIKRGGEIKFIY